MKFLSSNPIWIKSNSESIKHKRLPKYPNVSYLAFYLGTNTYILFILKETIRLLFERKKEETKRKIWKMVLIGSRDCLNL